MSPEPRHERLRQRHARLPSDNYISPPTTITSPHPRERSDREVVRPLHPPVSGSVFAILVGRNELHEDLHADVPVQEPPGRGFVNHAVNELSVRVVLERVKVGDRCGTGTSASDHGASRCNPILRCLSRWLNVRVCCARRVGKLRHVRRSSTYATSPVGPKVSERTRYPSASRSSRAPTRAASRDAASTVSSDGAAATPPFTTKSRTRCCTPMQSGCGARRGQA